MPQFHVRNKEGASPEGMAAHSCCGAASSPLIAFFGIPKSVLLLVRNHEFSQAAIQAHENFRKDPDDRFVETIKSGEMEGHFALKALLVLGQTRFASTLGDHNALTSARVLRSARRIRALLESHPSAPSIVQSQSPSTLNLWMFGICNTCFLESPQCPTRRSRPVCLTQRDFR